MLFGVAAGAVGLGLLEGVLAALGLGETDRYDDPYLAFDTGAGLFAPQTKPSGARVYATRPEKLAFFNHQEFARDKPPGALRVFALGGSTTFGHPYDDALSFARWLERYLDAAEPERPHEVVNAGGISYASYRIVELARELVRYSPDVFVVYTGHNEFLEERTYRELVHQPEALLALRARLSRYRLAALIRAAAARIRPPPEREQLPAEVRTRLDVWTGLEAFHRDDDLRRSILDHFGSNLERLVEIAHDHGVAILFVKPVSNLKDFSPFKSEHLPGLDAEAERRFGELMERGMEGLRAGDADAAAGSFAAALELDPGYAEASFRLGRSLLERGRVEQAERAFVDAKDQDVAPLRALEAELELIAQTVSRHRLVLVDLPRLLQEDAQRRYRVRLLGNEYLLDHVHPDVATHALIARELLAALVGSGLVHPDPGFSLDQAHRRLEQAVLPTLESSYYARRDLNLGKVLGWAGKLEEAEPPLRRAAPALDDDPDLHLTLGTLLVNTGRPSEAIDHLRRAVALAPTEAAAHFNLGIACGKLGLLGEGIAALERAVALQPDYAEAYHNLGVLRRAAGDAEGALASLRRALELAPEVVEVRRSLAETYRQAGLGTAATEVLREAAERQPTLPGLRRDLGLSLALEGRLEEAARALEEALTIDPADAEAWYHLGVVLDRLGRPEPALAALERATALAPSNGRAQLALALLHRAAGHVEEARASYRRAVAAGLAIPTEIAASFTE